MIYLHLFTPTSSTTYSRRISYYLKIGQLKRNYIYPTSSITNILQTCSRVHSEACPIFYNENQFGIHLSLSNAKESSSHSVPLSDTEIARRFGENLRIHIGMDSFENPGIGRMIRNHGITELLRLAGSKDVPIGHARHITITWSLQYRVVARHSYPESVEEMQEIFGAFKEFPTLIVDYWIPDRGRLARLNDDALWRLYYLDIKALVERVGRGYEFDDVLKCFVYRRIEQIGE